MATIDPIVLKFRAALDEVYGKRIERVVLYGSRARGDARPGSEYDIAVFLNGLSDRWSEFDRIAQIETDILYETGIVIHASLESGDKRFLRAAKVIAVCSENRSRERSVLSSLYPLRW